MSTWRALVLVSCVLLGCGCIIGPFAAMLWGRASTFTTDVSDAEPGAYFVVFAPEGRVSLGRESVVRLAEADQDGVVVLDSRGVPGGATLLSVDGDQRLNPRTSTTEVNGKWTDHQLVMFGGIQGDGVRVWAYFYGTSQQMHDWADSEVWMKFAPSDPTGRAGGWYSQTESRVRHIRESGEPISPWDAMDMARSDLLRMYEQRR